VEDKTDENNTIRNNACSTDCRSKLDYTHTLPRLINTLALEFDNWKWLLTLICIFSFFFAILPYPVFFFAGYYYPFVYLWLLGWLTVAILMEYAVQMRKTKAVLSAKWVSKPHAVDEYCSLIEE